MECCDDLNQALKDEFIVRAPKGSIADGRILNDVFSDYYIRVPKNAESYNYYAITYCPFCGRAFALE